MTRMHIDGHIIIGANHLYERTDMSLHSIGDRIALGQRREDRLAVNQAITEARREGFIEGKRAAQERYASVGPTWPGFVLACIVMMFVGLAFHPLMNWLNW